MPRDVNLKASKPSIELWTAIGSARNLCGALVGLWKYVGTSACLHGASDSRTGVAGPDWAQVVGFAAKLWLCRRKVACFVKAIVIVR